MCVFMRVCDSGWEESTSAWRRGRLGWSGRRACAATRATPAYPLAASPPSAIHSVIAPSSRCHHGVITASSRRQHLVSTESASEGRRACAATRATPACPLAASPPSAMHTVSTWSAFGQNLVSLWSAFGQRLRIDVRDLVGADIEHMQRPVRLQHVRQQHPPHLPGTIITTLPPFSAPLPTLWASTRAEDAAGSPTMSHLPPSSHPSYTKRNAVGRQQHTPHVPGTVSRASAFGQHRISTGSA